MTDPYHKIIKGGLVVGPESIQRADIAIKDGKIAGIASDLGNDAAGEIIDGTGSYILPGLIDAHVHPVYVDTIEDCSV